MKAIKFAVVILALSAVSAMATDGVVTWSIDMPSTSIDPGVDTYFDFFINVEVTGNNQGLAFFQNDIRIRKVSTDTNIVGHPTSFGWSYWMGGAYKSPSSVLQGSVVDSAAAGGPGLGTKVKTLGYQNAPGFIDDVGAGILDWNPVRLDGKAWTGDHQWGIGMASRKANLLVNPAGEFLVNYGYWTMASWLASNPLPGDYRIEVLPVTASVLLAEKDLNVPDTGVMAVADSVVGASMVFTIIPEPATLLLLAGAGAFIRRRRA